MLAVLFCLVCFLVGTALGKTVTFLLDKSRESKSKHKLLSLEQQEAEADKILHEADPALAIELGYEAPKVEPKAPPMRPFPGLQGLFSRDQSFSQSSQQQRNADFAAIDAQMRQLDKPFRDLDQLFNQAAFDLRQLQQMQGMPHPGPSPGKCNCLLSVLQPGCDCTCNRQQSGRH